MSLYDIARARFARPRTRPRAPFARDDRAHVEPRRDRPSRRYRAVRRGNESNRRSIDRSFAIDRRRAEIESIARRRFGAFARRFIVARGARSNARGSDGARSNARARSNAARASLTDGWMDGWMDGWNRPSPSTARVSRRRDARARRSIRRRSGIAIRNRDPYANRRERRDAIPIHPSIHPRL